MAFVPSKVRADNETANDTSVWGFIHNVAPTNISKLGNKHFDAIVQGDTKASQIVGFRLRHYFEPKQVELKRYFVLPLGVSIESSRLLLLLLKMKYTYFWEYV